MQSGKQWILKLSSVKAIVSEKHPLATNRIKKVNQRSAEKIVLTTVGKNVS